MRANRRQSLAELCNLKLVRLAKVPHRTARTLNWFGTNDSYYTTWENPKQIQIDLHTETVQMDNFTVRVKLSEYNSIETG